MSSRIFRDTLKRTHFSEQDVVCIHRNLIHNEVHNYDLRGISRLASNSKTYTGGRPSCCR